MLDFGKGGFLNGLSEMDLSPQLRFRSEYRACLAAHLFDPTYLPGGSYEAMASRIASGYGVSHYLPRRLDPNLFLPEGF